MERREEGLMGGTEEGMKEKVVKGEGRGNGKEYIKKGGREEVWKIGWEIGRKGVKGLLSKCGWEVGRKRGRV